MAHFRKSTRIEAPASEVFDWHVRPGAFERLAPPWEPVEILDRTGGIEVEGARVVLSMRFGPFRTRWVAEHRGFIPGREFRDVQVEGPFARFEHTHRVTPDGPEACVLADEIDYALPGGMLGRILGGRFVRRRLERMFAYRHRITAGDLAAHAGGAPLGIDVAGADGVVGAALLPFLTTGGHEIGSDDADAFVDLAGERRLRGSPRVHVGVGPLDAAPPAASPGVRVVQLRVGEIVVRGAGRRGHAPAHWIGLDDLVGVILHAIRDDRLAGPIEANAARPDPALERTGYRFRDPDRDALLRRPR